MRPDAGLLFALAAFSLWGFFPVYWKLLLHVPADQILAHRMVWSLAFLCVVLGVQGRWIWIKTLTFRVASLNLVAATFLTANWFVYIWAVNSGHVVETALGYFINPLVSVVLGALFLGERPRRLQWAAIAAAASGVIFLSVAHGKPPWIALFLAGSFGVYGLIKKQTKLRAAEGLVLETGLVFLPALAYLAFLEFNGQSSFGHTDFRTDALLIFSGVATALPLLFFAAATRRLTLTSLGIMQYLAPSIQFGLGVFLYQEPFTLQRLIGFGAIWIGVALYVIELVIHRRKSRLSAQPLSKP